MIAAAAVFGASASLHAQGSRQGKQTIVIPQELLQELQRVIQEAIGEDALKDISRDLGRDLRQAMEGFGRGVGRFGPEIFGGAFMQDKDFRAEAVDRQTRALAIGPNGSLELKNVVGDITIRAGSGREASVEIVRTSRGRTDADAKLGLQRVNATVSTRGSRGSVEVEYPEERRPPYYVSVAFNVTAPAGASVMVQTITGNVTLNGIKGETSVNTTTGNVDISQATDLTAAHTVTGKLVVRDSQGGALDVGTMNGAVLLSNVKAKRLEISAVTGPITATEIQAAAVEASCMSCDMEYSGPVAAGGSYEFNAHSGEIRLGLTGGFDFSGHSFSGKVDADPSLGLKAAVNSERVGLGPRRQMLRGTVSGGGASVEATTFSGDIKLGRKVEAAPAKGKTGGSK
jgi:hypothetical protein